MRASRCLAVKSLVVSGAFLWGVLPPLAVAQIRPPTLEERVETLEETVEDLESNAVLDLDPYVKVEPDETLDGVASPHVIFEGVNIHVRSGSGETGDQSELTGLGNLIIGYNEQPVTPPEDSPQDRTGSHNLVIGPDHNYSGHGGFVAGAQNTISGSNASVSGGKANVASGMTSSVSGGSGNEASGILASICGGLGNEASEKYAAICDGEFPPDASTTERGIVELATDAETQAGTDTERAVTPASLSSRKATTGRTGLVRRATEAQADTGTNTSRYMTPALVKRRIDAIPQYTPPDASTTERGIVELATGTETQAGTDTERAVTPASLSSRTATTGRTGLVERATEAEADTGTDTSRYMTPALVSRRIDAIPQYTPPDASTTERGIVELATDTETQAGTDTERAVTPAGLASVLGDVLPPGTLLDFAGGTAPSGFLLCDGQAVSRTDYANLFTAIGTTWGTGDGSTTFNLPDLRRSATIGSGGTQVAGPGTAVGDTGGVEQMTLTTGQLPSHRHTGPSHSHSVGSHSHSGPSHTHDIDDHSHSGPSHSHSGPSHTHPIPSHDHSVKAHRHTISDHAHSVEYRDESGAGSSYGFEMAWGPSTFDDDGAARVPSSGGGGNTSYSGDTNNPPNETWGSGWLSTNAGGTGNTGSGGTGNTGDTSLTTDSGGTGNTGSTSLTTGSGGTGNTGSVGSGDAVALMQPSAVVLKIIKF